MLSRTLTLAVAAALSALPTVAQMEKRTAEQYEADQFATAAPAIGTAAPDLQLCDLDGRPRCLSVLRGRTVVLIKGSYT